MPIDTSLEVNDVRTELRELADLVDAAVHFMLDIYEAGRDGDGRARNEDAVTSRIDRFARDYLACRAADGADPTQERLAEFSSVSDRWIRMIGWTRIQDRAAELEVATGSES